MINYIIQKEGKLVKVNPLRGVYHYLPTFTLVNFTNFLPTFYHYQLIDIFSGESFVL